MFDIKINRPKLLGEKDIEDTTVSEAIETIYKNGGRMIDMNWNKFIIPIFGFSIGDLYFNIVNILNAIKREDNVFIENFLDFCFTAKWVCEIKNEDLKITAFWTTIPNLEAENITIDKLREISNVVVVDKEKFIQSWETLLKVIKEDLISVGYDNTLDGFEYLDTL